jgi:hypothetical protein
MKGDAGKKLNVLLLMKVYIYNSVLQKVIHIVEANINISFHVTEIFLFDSA